MHLILDTERIDNIDSLSREMRLAFSFDQKADNPDFRYPLV